MTKKECEKIKQAIELLIENDETGIVILCKLVGVEYGFMPVNNCPSSSYKEIPIDDFDANAI